MTLEQFFLHLAKDIEARKHEREIMKIVDICRKATHFSKVKFDENHSSAADLKKQLKKITKILYKQATKTRLDLHGEQYAWACHFLDLAEEEPERLGISAVFGTVEYNYNAIKDEKCTYLLIADAIKMADLKATEEQKKLISKVLAREK